MKWAVDDPARFQREQTELDALLVEVDWFSCAWGMNNEAMLEVDFDMRIHGRTYEARLTYPEGFPDTPPYIRPRDHASRWTVHQYWDGGALCLRWRPDNWQPHVTGAEMIRDAYELLSTETAPENPGVVPSAHRVTEGQRVRSSTSRLVLTPQTQTSLLALPKGSVSSLKCREGYHFLWKGGGSFTVVMFIVEITSNGADTVKIADIPAGVENLAAVTFMKRDGIVIRNQSLVKEKISTSEELVAALEKAGVSRDEALKSDDGQKLQEREFVLFGDDITSLRLFSITGDVAEPKIDSYHVISAASGGARLPPEHRALHDLSVAIVGLGSIGSKLAVSLARSGVRKFLLIDDDFVSPENICRHELSWMFVGVQKVEAMLELLSLIAPDVRVTIKSHRFAGQESSVTAAGVTTELSKCDILIDASANPEVFVRLAGIAKRNKKAMCWGEVFAGGYGGLIARSRPDLDAYPLAVRDGINTHLNGLAPAPFKDATGYDGNEEQPLTAYDSDVTHIASALTRLVLDTALRRTPSDFPYPAYLIGMRKEWIFEQPFDTQPIEIAAADWGTEEPVDQALQAEVIGKLLNLALVKEKDAESDPTQ